MLEDVPFREEMVMHRSRIRRPGSFQFAAAIALAMFVSCGSHIVRGQDKAAEDKAGKQRAEARGPWRAFGKVTDQDGKPLAGVEVRAHCGMGTLRRTGLATSSADGKYELNFGPGIMFGRDNK